ncbi:MAG: 4-(cytidine 5'-diphospho)-2-C-methyl-D-erythritol kinase [Prevotellaceae bacterium]|nr:4-(cytidine 5'-diphospho)-2-C-methyl-D-erythritol kinase [Prevotellaceae bacterium]
MIVNPCAKINLGLNVVRKREDGYHDLETVFYPVNILDTIDINVSKGKQEHNCELSIKGIEIEGDMQQNLVVKAYKMLAERYALPDVHVELTKAIPTQAGMGGGSSDCAYMIRALNDLFSLDMNIHEMQLLAAKLGADCAFFINPVPSYAEGIGERLAPIDVDLSNYHLAIVKPPVPVSTKEAFSKVTPIQPEKCCKDIVLQPIDTWKDELVNDFEQSVIPLHPEIGEIKDKLYDMGAIYAAMSGSGSALFGIFKDKPENLDNIFKGYYTAIAK